MRMSRKIAVSAAAAALLGTAGAAAAQAAISGDAGAEGAAATPTCAVSGLSASVREHLAGGMNHVGITLELRNTADHSCALRGYPGLGLEDSEHRRLTSDTSWGGTWYADDPGKETVTLKPKGTVEANVAWTRANSGTPEARHAAYLVVTPPASTDYKTVKLDTWVDNGDLAVTAVAREVPVGR
ncbi:DUF4232 domain-containing protein [Streptomyces sp. SCSIO ZS0520]|uniref:DUF4232 domain-containing protein n=1 Tax=Streptomyces sp. SCSIO ZS0520 TaxID=2892996 RepID=UPI0021D8FE1B|nr:DUF4232 domain-containing protein [Streptomyces sp. SCSIO ZS0520]